MRQCEKPGFAPTPNGHECRGSQVHIPHHCHDRAYAALILSGSYEESGSRGRFRVGPGDVLLHDAFDAHLDRFQSGGARIFSLWMKAWPSGISIARVADPDAIVRIAERDAVEAAVVLLAELRRRLAVHYDWPDILANDLLSEPDWRLDHWARKISLAPATVSRGFRKVFGITPAAFRWGARTRRAFRMIKGSDLPFAAVAATTGFADQAHMSRAVRALTGATPGSWRRSNSFKTEAAPYA
jgi:AraC-like DNA-binding protein